MMNTIFLVMLGLNKMSYLSLEFEKLPLCECVRLGYDRHNVHFVVEGLDELYIKGFQAVKKHKITYLKAKVQYLYMVKN